MRDVVGGVKRDVATGGLEEVGAYTIKADAKMFKILIDSLYSDKPRAVVRELCTNALDSHAAAGIPERPFYLRLPTRFDHTFAVRDYGVSLSHDGVMNLYTTVGLSTKEDSNTQVGKFGLGSKVPFAYTDSFTITAVLDGKKRLYNAFIDTDGCPKIALLMTEDTDEEKGLEISFPVKDSDVTQFRAAAQRVLFGFDVLPKSNHDFTNLNAGVIKAGEGWRMIKRDYDSGITGAFVRQGCVLYPIDAAALRNVRYSNALNILAQETFIIDMPIGTVDITPSRESLSYDPTTCKNILDRLDGMLDVVVAGLVEPINTAKTYFESSRMRSRILNNIGNYPLREAVDARMKWRGKKVFDTIAIGEKKTAILSKHGVNFHCARVRKVSRSGRRNGEFGLVATNMSVNASCETFQILYYEGKEPPRYLGLRISAALNTRYNVSAYVLPNFKRGGFAEAAIKVALGRPHDGFIDWVDLSKVAFTKPDYKRTLTGLKQLSGTRWMDVKTPEDDAEGIYFIHTHRNEPKDCSVGMHTLDLLWGGIKEVGLLNPKARLIAIPASRRDIAKDIPDAWEEFLPSAKAAILEAFDANRAARAACINTLKALSVAGNWVNLLQQFAPLISKQSPLYTAFLDLKELTTYTKEDERQQKLLALLQHVTTPTEQETLVVEPDVTAFSAPFWKNVALVKARYPILTTVVGATHYTFGDDDLKAVAGYITLVDDSVKGAPLAIAA